MVTVNLGLEQILSGATTRSFEVVPVAGQDSSKDEVYSRGREIERRLAREEESPKDTQNSSA